MRRAGLVVGAVLVLLAAAGGWIYNQIQSGFNTESELAMERALTETTLARADHVDYFAGEFIYRIVYGVNADNEKLIVWVGPQEVHEAKASDGVTRSDVRAFVEGSHGTVEWNRLVPGKYEDEYVWEAYFKKKEIGGVRPFYEYYRFRDGERIDTLRLNIE